MLEDIYPVRRAGKQAVVTLPEDIDLSNAGQIREQLLTVINRGAAVLIADMTATISCDYADGWLYDQYNNGHIWITHNGGASWREITCSATSAGQRSPATSAASRCRCGGASRRSRGVRLLGPDLDAETLPVATFTVEGVHTRWWRRGWQPSTRSE